MAETNSTGARKLLTRVLAAGALLAIYCVSTVAVTTTMIAGTTTSAQAYWRGGRGRGWGGGRGWRGGGRRWVCRHNGYTSGRRCFWL
jgi:hypothetical protein